MLPLKILTLNVKGMASPARRAVVFRFLRDHPAHVAAANAIITSALAEAGSANQ